jgi:type VI secretion system protein ImpM
MDEAPGWYGKLASLGDFAHRRLPQEWLQACDAWLSQTLRIAAERLGPRWLEVYLTAPLLRFAWAPGVMGTPWWFGVLMPSCDAVGRYYPLIVAQPRARPPVDRIAIDHLELWFAQAARATLRTLHEQLSADDFDAQLVDLPPWPTARMLPRPDAAAALQRYRIEGDLPLSQWLQALASQALLDRLPGCTLWWQAPEEGAAGALSIAQGLPDALAFVELLCGSGA